MLHIVEPQPLLSDDISYSLEPSVIGGFRAQGRTAVRARALLDDALRLQDAGCFAVVLECIPGNVALAITETLEIPTIGKEC